MEEMVTYTKTLRLFAKSETSLQVCCQVEIVSTGAVMGTITQVRDEYVDDDALTAIAEADNRTTWDENDICTALGAVRGTSA